MYRIIFFLLLNFGALYLGSKFTSSGVSSTWYATLNKAPWTPPGWVFGAAWTTIMICFSVYMAQLYKIEETKTQVILLFALQWVLNIAWNPTFFYFKNLGLASIIILSLTVVVALFLILYLKALKGYSLLILPYLIWLIIADSLSIYASLKN
ncbi:MAG: TspO/MBR family protein [Flavobacteriaceae bacterium]